MVGWRERVKERERGEGGVGERENLSVSGS